MTTAPAKDKRKEEKDNIFIDILYNVVVYIPVLIISWIWEKISE
jgi:hypothetical protein